MTKRLSILCLVAIAWLASSQLTPASAKETTEHDCELTPDDYAVIGALLSGLHVPEDPEEAWDG